MYSASLLPGDQQELASKVCDQPRYAGSADSPGGQWQRRICAALVIAATSPLGNESDIEGTGQEHDADVGGQS
jgi:hypothetical protein